MFELELWDRLNRPDRLIGTTEAKSLPKIGETLPPHGKVLHVYRCGAKKDFRYTVIVDRA